MINVLFAAFVCFPAAMLLGVNAAAMWYDRRFAAATALTVLAVGAVLLGSLSVAFR